jgi:uncharacterized glyoxalase superfamily protein PhnB
MPGFVSRIAYRDARAALAFLEKAFGFQTISQATAADGSVVHAEMKFGDGRLTIGGEWENVKPPIAVGGANTQNIHVHLEDSVDQHCETARAAGAVIVQEPQDQFHGERNYRVMDPQGHMWIFGQTIAKVTNEQIEAALPGIKVTGLSDG